MLVFFLPSPHQEQRFYTRCDWPQITLPISDRTTTTTFRSKFSALLTEIKCLANLLSLGLLFQHVKYNNLASLPSFIEMITMPMD